MALWDGMGSSDRTGRSGYGVIVLGATNRPYDVDKAILRRMPRTFEISMPSVAQREQILGLILQGTPCDQSVDLNKFARLTAGYSGSDLKELCRAAAMAPVRDFIRIHGAPAEEEEKGANLEAGKEGKDGNAAPPKPKGKLRPLSMHDLEIAKRSVLPTGASANEYRQQEQAGNEQAAEVNVALREVSQRTHSLPSTRLSRPTLVSHSHAPHSSPPPHLPTDPSGRNGCR